MNIYKEKEKKYREDLYFFPFPTLTKPKTQHLKLMRSSFVLKELQLLRVYALDRPLVSRRIVELVTI